MVGGQYQQCRTNMCYKYPETSLIMENLARGLCMVEYNCKHAIHLKYVWTREGEVFCQVYSVKWPAMITHSLF